MRRRSILSAIEKGSVGFSEWVSVTALLGITFLVFVNVLLRYVFKAPLAPTEEIVAFMAVFFWFFSMAYAAYCDFHISSNFPIRNQRARTVFTTLKPVYCLIITAVFCYYSYQHFWWTYTAEARTTSLGMPLFYGTLFIFIGLVLTTVFFIREAVIKIRALRHEDKTMDEGDLK